MQIQFYQYIVQLNISVYLQFPRSTAIQLKEIALMFDYVKRANFSTKHASFVSKILRISALFMRRYSSVLLLEFKTSQLYILKTKLGGEIYSSDANIQGHPTTIFGKYLFGRRFQIWNFRNICCKISACLPLLGFSNI